MRIQDIKKVGVVEYQEAVASAGFDVRVTQLTAASAFIDFQTDLHDEVLYTTSRVTGGLAHLFAPAIPGQLTFAMETKDSKNKSHGLMQAQNTIHAWRQDHHDFVQDGLNCNIHVSEAELKAALYEAGAYNALDNLTSCNRLDLPAAAVSDFWNIFEGGKAEQINKQQVLGFLTCALEGKRDVIDEPRNLSSLTRLAQFAHEQNDGEALRLSDMCKHVARSSSSLSEMTQEVWGLGPVEYYRHVRLVQCREAFLRPQGPQTIKSVRERYGFRHKSRFNAWYKDLFMETPMESYMRGQGQLSLQGIDAKGAGFSAAA